MSVWLDSPRAFIYIFSADDVSFIRFNKASHDGLSLKKKNDKVMRWRSIVEARKGFHDGWIDGAPNHACMTT
jgi:hypothetical protein